MRSAAEADHCLAPERSADLLEHVDYRLAETPEEKDEIYRLRYRAYLREGAIAAFGRSERVTDQYDDAPNTWIFGVYIHGELYSSLRVSVADLGMADRRRRLTCSAISCIPSLIGAESSSIPPVSSPIPKRPRRFPELPYVTVRLGWIACGYFNADIGLAQRSSRASGVLSPGVPAAAAGRAASVPGSAQAGRV